MKHGGLKLLERRPCRLTSRYEADARRRCERPPEWRAALTQQLGKRPCRGCKAAGMVTVTPPARGALALA